MLTALILIVATHLVIKWEINTATMCYSRSQLLEFNSSATHDARLPPSVYRTITALGINSRPATRRGTRAGCTHIPSPVRPTCSSSPRSYPSTYTRSKLMNVSLWNAQSIRNKISTLHDNITYKDTDIAFITETWFNEYDQVALGELGNIPGYAVLNTPRINQGGVVLRLSTEAILSWN